MTTMMNKCHTYCVNSNTRCSNLLKDIASYRKPGGICGREDMKKERLPKGGAGSERWTAHPSPQSISFASIQLATAFANQHLTPEPQSDSTRTSISFASPSPRLRLALRLLHQPTARSPSPPLASSIVFS